MDGALSCIDYDATTFSIAKQASKIPCSDIRYVRVKVTLAMKPIFFNFFIDCFQTTNTKDIIDFFLHF